MIKKIGVIAGAAALISVMISARASAENFYAVFSCDNSVVEANGEVYSVQGTPFLYKNNTYVPVDDILKHTGFETGWDDGLSAVVAYKDGEYSYIGVDSNVLVTGGTEFIADVPTKMYNGVFYMPLVMYAELSDAAIYLDGTPKKYRDLLLDTFVTDEYRLPDGIARTYKGVTIVGNRGMDILSIPDFSAKSYAEMVNSVARAMPEHVNVFNVALPTSCEFYAPRSLYTNQTSGIRKIYSMLDERVTPINAVKPLMEHAAEKIYFDTDHHWTQRGAYYAYREFAAIQGFDMPELTDFEKADSWSHIGSFAAYTKGTYGETIMRSNPELLERFIPRVSSFGEAYTDMNMTKKYYSPSAVNTRDNTYVCFMGGDCPVAKFTTDIKNGRKLCIIKESFGNAFASWAINHYEEVYIIDPREFNGFNGHNTVFKLTSFYNNVQFNDLLIINYPGSISSSAYRNSVLNML